MIAYPVEESELWAAIDAEKSSWRRRAKERTDKFLQNGKYDESSGIWSEIKRVYMNLQGEKCIFCERKLAGGQYGTIEHDLEHFRPKSQVRKWPPEKSLLEYDFSTGEDAQGYYWLAYDPFNYATACKICNSMLKSDYFPIGKERGSVSQRPQELVNEQPYLCYPIGSWDDDPEMLLTFKGPIAIPIGDKEKKRRGQIIIDFFELNLRDELVYGRSVAIKDLGNALDAIADDRNIERNQRIVDLSLSSRAPFTSCSKAFLALWQSDRTLAKNLHEYCVEIYLGGASIV